MLIWLVDFDGKIENLALMRLSAWHKARGDTVRLKFNSAHPELFERPDKVYVSCIFRWNKVAALRLKDAYGELASVGGTGVDIQAQLSPDIAVMPPDYELYGASRAIGFISRGCPRRCRWCVVPEKEGALQRVATAREIVEGAQVAAFGCSGHGGTVIFLDNNFLALPDYQRDLRWLAKSGVAIDFNQGLDARLVTDEAARLLAACQWKTPGGEKVRLALDSEGQKQALGRAVGKLVRADMKPHDIFVYCLIGHDGLDSDLDRLFYLRSLGARVFPMGYRELENGKEPMRGWNEKIYRKYKRLLIRMPFASAVWDDLLRATR